MHSYGPKVPQSQGYSVFSGLGSNTQHPVPSNPVFAQNMKVNNAAVIAPSPQNGSALLVSVSSPHVVVPCTAALSNLQTSSSTCRFSTAISFPSSMVTQTNNYTRPSIARMSVKDSAALKTKVMVSNTCDPTDISISQKTAEKDDCIILSTQGNPISADCVIVSSSPVRPDVVEVGHQRVQPQEGIVGTSEPLGTAQRTEQEPKLMQERDTVPTTDDRVKNGVQQSFLEQVIVPTKPLWQVPVIPVSPATMQTGKHMLMNQSPAVTPMTHRYLYPQLQYPGMMVPQQRLLPSILRTSTPTSYIFPH